MEKVIPKEEEFIFEGKVAISQTDLKGNITFVNRKFCEISGYTSRELVNSDHIMIKHPDMPKETFEKISKTLRGGQVWTGLLKNLRKDGKFYWVNIEIAPILNKQEQITGYISVSKTAPRKDIADNNKQLTQKNITK